MARLDTRDLQGEEYIGCVVRNVRKESKASRLLAWETGQRI